jgi:hypothetical protein
MSKETIIDALSVTAEAMGQQISPAGLLLMADDLEQYGAEQVLAALARVRRECRKLTVADVIERIASADGRPGADEAWANAQLAHDESMTVVWTQEAAEAFWIARPLLVLGDKTGARMAFRDTYLRLCEEARLNGRPVQWQACLGFDAEQRAEVLGAAVQAGKIGAEYARGLLPPPENPERTKALLSLVSSHGVLTDQAASAIERETARERISAIKEMLAAKKSI